MAGSAGIPSRVRRLLQDSAVSVAVAAGVFLACEGVLRLFAPQTLQTLASSASPRAVADSVLGHRYAPGAHVRYRTPEFTASYQIGPDGRRVIPVAVAPDSAALRILVLGDSFTFGVGCEADEVWTAALERALRTQGVDAVVLNAGVEGYDTRSELLYLQRIGPALHPDLVVLGFLANDVYTNLPLEAPAPNSVRDHRARRELHTLALVRRLLVQNDRAYTRLFLLSRRKDYYAAVPTERTRRQLEVTGALLDGMRAWCGERGVGLAVVSIPQQFAVIAAANGYEFDGIDPAVIDAHLAPFARARGVPWIDLLPALANDYRAHRTDLYYRVDGHFTARGNRVAGETAATALAAHLRTGAGGAR